MSTAFECRSRAAPREEQRLEPVWWWRRRRQRWCTAIRWSRASQLCVFFTVAVAWAVTLLGLAESALVASVEARPLVQSPILGMITTPMRVEQDAYGSHNLQLGGMNAASCADAEAGHLRLIVGVKSSVLRGAEARMAIRETWAAPSTLPCGVRVLFLGCAPTFEGLNETERARSSRDVERERQRFGDLLTDELACRDSYTALVGKVVAFFHWTTMVVSRFSYVMLVDDDVYVRVDQLLSDVLGFGSPAMTNPLHPRQRFYAGQVWAVQHGRPILPQRDPLHKNYLSEENYAMPTLPPFAIGPHYIISADIARFIARNHHDLRGIGTLEDVSIALWLLGLQVYPVHLPRFSNLRDTLCRNDLLSFADLSSHAIRQIHSNLRGGYSFCRGFSHSTWLQPLSPPKQSTLNASNPEIDILWSIHFNIHSRRVEVPTTISFLGKSKLPDSVRVTYLPSAVSIFTVCEAASSYVNARTLLSVSSTAMCHQYRRLLLAGVDETLRAGPATRALFSLFQHNLKSDLVAPVVVIGLSEGAKNARTVLECLFGRVFNGAEVLLIDEGTLTVSGVPMKHPDVFVYSVLDEGDPLTRSSSLDNWLRNGYVDRFGSTTAYVMIKSETWDVAGLDSRVILLSTEVVERHAKHIYLPVASTAFGETTEFSPLALLRPQYEHQTSNQPMIAHASASASVHRVLTSTKRAAAIVTPKLHPRETRRFCAYLYARCDHPLRGYMFDLLNAMEPVDALGVCQGPGRAPIHSRSENRRKVFYHDDAVSLLSGYKFVIAFENARVPGYVTEKLTNAFLAGSVPIYWGHSPTVAQLFNPRSFIDCGQYATLRECANAVLVAHHSPKLYAEMLREPPVRNVTAFREVFSWHPDVASDMMADRLRELLNDA